MSSRMERYYKTDVPKQRSSLNKELYESIYEKGSYSNIEGITTIDKPNEIDIEQVKRMIIPEKKVERKLDDSFRKSEHKISIEKDYDSRAYDIRDVLKKAKDERSEDDKKYNLRNTQYDILKNLKIENAEQKEELKELFNTITNNSKLNQLNSKTDGFEALDSLKSNGTNTDNSLSIKQILEEKKDYKYHKEDEIDKSFFTSSLGFKDEDFEDEMDNMMEEKSNNTFLKVIIFIMLVIILTGAIYFGYQFIIKK